MDKGPSFERDCCRLLSLWITNGKRDDVLWRNRVRITSKTKHAEYQLGDVTAAHALGIPFISVFNVELKTGYSKTRKGKRTKNIPWDLLDLIDGKDKTFLNFWEQTYRDACISQRIPLLIFKRDYHEPAVAIRSMDINRFESYLGFPKYKHRLVLISKDEWESIELFNFEEFFDWLHPDAVKMLFHMEEKPKFRLVTNHKKSKLIRREQCSVKKSKTCLTK